jgi:DNA replication protein DnaC
MTDQKKPTTTELTVAEELLLTRLKDMRLSGMAEALRKQFENPNSDLRPADERISEVIEAEWLLRYNKKFDRYLKGAALRYPAADLDETLYDPERELDIEVIEQLASCSWIDEKRNLLITGPTSGGKSYLSNALCISAIRKFKSVRYVKASTLMGELERARLDSAYLEYLKKIAKLDLLAIDDFGLMELDLDKCRDLFEVIDTRDGRKSTLIISQLPVSKWFDMFADSTYADACLSRMTDRRHAYRLEMNGKSMRVPA